MPSRRRALLRLVLMWSLHHKLRGLSARRFEWPLDKPRGGAGRREAACAHTLSPKPFELEPCGVGHQTAPRARRFSAHIRSRFRRSLCWSEPTGRFRHRERDGRAPPPGLAIVSRVSALSPSGLIGGRGERLRLRFHAARYAELPRTPIASPDTDGPDRPLDPSGALSRPPQDFGKQRKHYTPASASGDKFDENSANA